MRFTLGLITVCRICGSCQGEVECVREHCIICSCDTYAELDTCNYTSYINATRQKHLPNTYSHIGLFFPAKLSLSHASSHNSPPLFAKNKQQISLSLSILISLSKNRVDRCRCKRAPMAYFDSAMNLGNDHGRVVPITMFVAVLCLCFVIGHLLEENRWVNESITAIFIVLPLYLSLSIYFCSVFFCVCVSFY